MDTLLSLIMIIPLAGAGLMALFEQFKAFFKKLKICPDCLMHIFSNLVAIATLTIGILTLFLTDMWELNQTTDGLLGYGLLEAVLISVFAFLVWMAVLFSVEYMKGKDGLGFYYALILTLLSGLSAVVMANNFFTLFIGWELFAVSGYTLVAFERVKRGAVEASLKYFLMLTAGSLLVLLATALTYGFYGTVNFAALQTGALVPSAVTNVIVALFIIGFGVTAAMLFLNAWLPDAHSNAPSTISALLSGIVVKAGAFGIYRTLFWGFTRAGGSVVPEISLVISWLGILTMIDGNLLVFYQFKRKDIVDLKRILAYSTTVHLGYVILGIGAGTAEGVEASVLHIITHSIGKGSLFLLSGVMIAAVSSRDLRKMKGLGRKSPFIGILMTIGLLSLGGIPITGGFVSKLLIILSAFNGNGFEIMRIIIVLFAVINSVLALGSYLYILKFVIFDPPEDEAVDKFKIPVFEAIPLVIMAVLIIFLGVWPGKLYELIVTAIEAVL